MKKLIFKLAHKIAKTLEGDYSVRLSMALKFIYKSMKDIFFCDKYVQLAGVLNLAKTGLHIDMTLRDNSNSLVGLRGKTFPIKEELKANGFKWNGSIWENSLKNTIEFILK